LVIFLIGFTFWSTAFIVIPFILCIGVLNAAVTDHCYLRMGIAMLPWNRRGSDEQSHATPIPAPLYQTAMLRNSVIFDSINLDGIDNGRI